VLDNVSGGVGPEALIITSATDPDNGTVTVLSEGTLGFAVFPAGTTRILYTPGQDWVGEEVFQVTVEDGYSESLSVPIRVTVNDVPDPVFPTGGEVVSSALPWAAGILALIGAGCLIIILVMRRRRPEESDGS
jgi:hypothetical protein